MKLSLVDAVHVFNTITKNYERKNRPSQWAHDGGLLRQEGQLPRPCRHQYPFATSSCSVLKHSKTIIQQFTAYISVVPRVKTAEFNFFKHTNESVPWQTRSYIYTKKSYFCILFRKLYLICWRVASRLLCFGVQSTAAAVKVPLNWQIPIPLQGSSSQRQERT